MGSRWQSRQGRGAAAALHGDTNSLYERIHTVLYEQVSHAVKTIVHSEETWAEGELIKRLVRYINKSVSEELLQVPWEDAAEQLIENSMHSYHASCGDRPWFYDIDLGPAYAAVIAEITRFRRQKVAIGTVQEKVFEMYEEKLDRMLLMKALWDGIEPIFEDPAVCKKLYNALSKTYQSALDATLTDTRRRQDQQRVEDFLQRWIHESMGRAWTSIEDSELLTEQTVCRLFNNLLYPFGDSIPFTTIPSVLITSIGPPPQNWAFIKQTIKELFRQWRSEADEPTRPAKRQRRAEISVPPKEEEEEQEEVEGSAKEEEVVSEAEGHPECMSAEDCIGSASDKLVRHMVDGTEGDLYCIHCWQSFVEQNPVLEGVVL